MKKRNISASRHDSNEIAKAIPPLSILCDMRVCHKSKMAAMNQKLVWKNAISQLIQKVATKFQRLYRHYQGRET